MTNTTPSPYADFDRGVLQAIGLAVVNFSQVEEALVLGVNVLIIGTLADDAADLMLRKSQFRSLLESFAGLYHHRFPSDDFEELKGLCKKLESLNDERNHLVHSFWTPGTTTDKLGQYRKAMRQGGPKIWDKNVSETDVLKLAERAEHNCGQLLEFIMERILQRINNVVPKQKVVI